MKNDVHDHAGDHNPLMQSKPPSSSIGLATRLWGQYLSKYWHRLALALVAMGVYAGSASFIPIGVEWINSSLSGTSDRFSAVPSDVLVWGPVIIVVLGAVNAGAQYIQSRLSLGAALSTLRDLQKDMFASLMALDFAQSRQEASGHAISRFTNDPMVLRETLTRVSNAVRDILTLGGLCAVMLYYDWVLFAVVLLVYPVIGWPVTKIGKFLRQKSSQTQQQAGDVAALVNETVAGARVVKTFSLEDYEKMRATTAFDKRLELLKSMAYVRALNEPFIFFVGSIALAIVIAVVAMRVMNGALSGPQFASFIIALLLLSQPARGLSTLNAVVQEGFGALERILSVIDMAPTIKDNTDATSLSIAGGEISFDGVSFSYDGTNPVLNDLSFNASAGATIAVVGESGAGKSTIFNLLPRLYEATGGAISIDGQEISRVTMSSLRNAIAFVGQEAFLFDDTIAANIQLGRQDASRDDVIEAARRAFAHDFIEDLPDGYETRVGEGGGKLSGGQRQRVALARAFLKDAPILLLDEATSALDAESEAMVQQALEHLSVGRTTIVIAHRLSTVRDADNILVLEKGRVIEQGTHDDLVKSNGVYARLADLQMTKS